MSYLSPAVLERTTSPPPQSPPARETSSPAAPVARSSNADNALIHLYRAEASGMTSSRQRLDTTTSWAITSSALVTTFSLGNTQISHAAILFLIMRFVFNIPIAGNVVEMLFSTLVYVFALLSLGLLIGTRAENQMQALQMSMTFILPSVFFSGFVFPRETMPWIFYALGTILPTTYFISLMRAIILRGAHFLEYWPHLLILIVMSILLFAFCALLFRKKIG